MDLADMVLVLHALLITNQTYELMMATFNPEFMDIFGAAGFLFILTVAVWGLHGQRPLPRWVFWVLFVIGILGLLVDVYFVIFFYVV